MNILTIVVAAYNMEQYLDRCLASVLSASSVDSLEVLVINDGSTDKTLEIAMKYQHNYPNTVRVIDKLNGGWGTAINSGINEANGKYFKILDSDDWFDTGALDAFVSLLQSVDADLVASSFSREYTDRDAEFDVYDKSICNRIMPFFEYLKANHYTKHLPIQAITFRTSILQKNAIHLSDRYYTDIEYNLIPLIYIQDIYFTQINLYKYFIGREGQSVSTAGYTTHLKDYVQMCKKVTDFYVTHFSEMDEDMRRMYFTDNVNIIRFSYFLLMSPVYKGTNVDRKAELKDFDSYLKTKSKELYESMNQIYVRKIIPFIWIWRLTGINVLNFK